MDQEYIRNKNELTSIYETMLQTIDLGIRIVDTKEELLLYNETMQRIEAMSPADVSGKRLTEAFHFQDERDSRLLQAIRHGETIQHEKQTYITYKGEQITTINHTFPIYQEGRVIAAAEIAKDITQMEKLVRENQQKSTSLFTFPDIIGSSQILLDVVEQAKRVTRTTSSVLIVGETGTGKELFAQSIHSASDRATGPFISQNCAALPESLIEGILFGTVKGAFTGAGDRPGLFEEAEGGTLLLDEINSLPANLQAKLLRALQEKSVTRLGDTKTRPIDVRVLTTMNEDPVDAIAGGRLRKDVYYRLGVVTLIVPPLSERKEDIPVLVNAFIRKYNRLFQMEVSKADDQVYERFMSYDWPGSVRELEHVIEAAMNLNFGEPYLRLHHLPPHFHHKTSGTVQTETKIAPPRMENLPDKLRRLEYETLEEALTQSSGNIKQAAKILGISRQSLQYRMQKFDMQRESFIVPK
ncbi:arginine utilization regulatory protein [Salsuginibacillus halophilus]|uniref:Arginine utilization regulatory protein n=1 Tax=Salsuginibacillus halophilus TaxID=517424 RepID=A0A2P8HFT5_9BACI|nr:sigma 54-interacting transcriptional regulator [Salsuginibacillus halophilus]PSL45088.1 arginine utilization regulatory protein [Salsuginibacillus halophilus]